MYRHSLLIKLGLDTNAVCATKLINKYLSLGLANSLSHAHQLFDQVPLKDPPLWTSLISAYARHNQLDNALHLFSLMLRQTQPDLDARPNHFVITAVARAIAFAPQHIFLGQLLHAHVVKSGFLPGKVIVETAFLDMYSKCGVIESARKLFEEMPYRNLVTCNAMLSGYMQNGMETHGSKLFYRMKCGEVYAPDEYSISTVLSGCVQTQDLVLGMQVHAYAIVGGFEVNCANSIANMYFSCGRIACATKIMDAVYQDTVSKLLSIRGYILNHSYVAAFRYVCSLGNVVEILNTDYTIFVPLLTICTKLSLVRVGKQVHGLFIAMTNSYKIINPLGEDGVIIGSALIDMYCKCGDVGEGKKVFETWPCEHVSLWNALISGYISNGLIETANVLFQAMPKKDIVSWTSMITGFVRNNMPQEGLDLLAKMYCTEGGYEIDGNCLTFVVCLEACTHLTDLEKGKQIHAKIIRRLPGVDTSNVVVGTALVEMYSRSGNLHYSHTVFDSMKQKNIVAWTSILTGFAAHGCGLQAIEMFQKMLDNGIQPNEVTFVTILTACSHCGLVNEGLQYFKEMKKYGLTPKEDHYTCLIDMLGRNGMLEEAWHLVREVEELGNKSYAGSIWAALLGACQLYENVEIGRKVAQKMLENEKQISATCIALYNVFATAGMWNEAYETREFLTREGIANGEAGLSRLCMPPL
nr:pentatricopeptide repeat-containing protein At2g13600-like [Ipomoea batatas]